jgi:FkbM family methyltransferase
MINFSSVPKESVIGKIMRLPFRLIPPGTIVYILQGTLKGKRWIVDSSTHGCWLGSYDYSRQTLFSKIIKEGSTVYDVGAHVGFYTLLFSTLVGPKGKVFAFEPSPRNICYLKRHLKLNCCDNVEVIEAAVTEKDGIAFFEEGIPRSTDHLATKGNFTVKTVSLDNLVLEGRIPVPDYIKINAEGAELLVISGAKRILENYNPTISLSMHNHNLHNQCCAFLKSLNYNLQSIYEDKDINNTNELLAIKRR